MSLYFSDPKYLKQAFKDSRKRHYRYLFPSTAFKMLIEGVEEENLENLCKSIQAIGSIQGHCTVEDAYSYSQLPTGLPFKCAVVLMENGHTLGNKVLPNGINASSWINHCYFVAKASSKLAKAMLLNCEKAFTLGLLHDYGRKFAHTAEHITKGYESLVDKGYTHEALACLTHSFLNGVRYAWSDASGSGFYIDDFGNPAWEANANKDDIAIFLDNYNYTEYDIILNIADLMATSEGIVSPAERIQDIAKRRKNFDPRNRLYFLASFNNTLLYIYRRIGGKISDEAMEAQKIKASKGVTLEQIMEKFEVTSKMFFDEYQKIN